MEPISVVELFKLVARGGFPQTAHHLWHEHFTHMQRPWAGDRAEAMLDELGEMSQWAREAPSKSPNEGWTGSAQLAWNFIFATGNFRYAKRPDEREMLMRAWGDPDGEILGDEIAQHQEAMQAALHDFPADDEGEEWKRGTPNEWNT